ncbi:hypothetical protein SCHPADRAFT_893067 [Schizopora paradoxa]|uniref:Uncharacterized protein n=1 Tax=Schizopora paradoxa TaxID=27342 RepID=A0A0H2RJ80_9AGAM|nr:hypothetical protein SCHPADRAFT_893067 [Schizopora paradoxa]
MNTARPTLSTTSTDEYPYSAPDFGGDAAHPSEIKTGHGAVKSTGVRVSNGNDDGLLRSVVDGYKAPSTPSDLPPHIPTPPELVNRQLGHSKQTSDNVKDSNNTSSSKSKSQLSIPPPSDIAAHQKKGEVDMGYIEKVGSTAMQSEQEKSNTDLGIGGVNKSRTSDSANVDTPQPNSNAAASRTSTTDQSATNINDASQRGSSGKPQKGEPGYEEPHEEERGAARGEGVPPSSHSNLAQDKEQDAADENGEGGEGQKGQNDEMYPEQRHAGKLEGVGPEYGAANRVTLSDRLQGVKEKVKGTILRKPEVKERGQERMTGELKKKEKEEADKASPFGNAPDDKSEEKGGDDAGNEADNDDNNAPQGNTDSSTTPSTEQKKDASRSRVGDESSNTLNDPQDRKDANEQQDAEAGLSEVPHAHPTEKGKVEQAANVDPEGSTNNEVEQKAHDNATTGQVN